VLKSTLSFEVGIEVLQNIPKVPGIWEGTVEFGERHSDAMIAGDTRRQFHGPIEVSQREGEERPVGGPMILVDQPVPAKFHGPEPGLDVQADE